MVKTFQSSFPPFPNLVKIKAHFDKLNNTDLFLQYNGYKLSRGEICVANFIPPANGARQGIIYWQKCDFSLKHLH